MGAETYEDWPDEEPKRRGPFGLWSAALFNICIAALPLAGAHAVRVVERDHLYTYEATPGARRASREVLEQLAHRLVQPGADAREQWDSRVAIELMENDIAAARGMLVSAPAMLSGEDRGRVARWANNDDSDADLESAALRMLTPGTRARYEATVPLLSRSTGEATQRVQRPFAVLGDATDFETEAQTVLTDANAPTLRLVLTGLGLALRTQLEPNVLAGASIIRSGLNADRLSPRFVAELEALAEAAAPRARFAAAVAQRSAAAPGDDRLAVLDAAFRDTIQERALTRLSTRLAEIGDIVTASNPTGALALMRHAQHLEDVPRLRLLAQTNPDRAIALAKRLTPDGALPAAGRGALAFTSELIAALAAAIAAGFGIAFATAVTTFEVLRGVLTRYGLLRPRKPPPPPEPPEEDDEPQLLSSFR